MNIIFIIIGLIILAIVVFIIYRLVLVKIQNKKLNAIRFERVREIYDKLKSGQELNEIDVLPFAKNILTRQTTFHLLSEYDKTNIFPKEYNTLIKAAESSLANWLEFPTELDACPDEMEHMERVTFDFNEPNTSVHYEVFKFKVNEPHWAAKEGWMIGVVGPYFDDSKPFDFTNGTFSRMSSTIENSTPYEEAKWVHENISMGRLK